MLRLRVSPGQVPGQARRNRQSVVTLTRRGTHEALHRYQERRNNRDGRFWRSYHALYRWTPVRGERDISSVQLGASGSVSQDAMSSRREDRDGGECKSRHTDSGAVGGSTQVQGISGWLGNAPGDEMASTVDIISVFIKYHPAHSANSSPYVSIS